jgi:hypothetical protein
MTVKKILEALFKREDPGQTMRRRLSLPIACVL